MNFKKAILSALGVTILSTGIISTNESVNASEVSEASTYYDNVEKRELKKLLDELNVRTLLTGDMDRYFGRKVRQVGYKAKAALKSEQHSKVSAARIELQKIYDEIDAAKNIIR